MKLAIIVILFLVLLAGGYVFFQNKAIGPSTDQSLTPTQTVKNTPSNSFCTPSQLEALLDPEVAAGNLYAQITIKNISDTTCEIVGNNMLDVEYPMSVTNFRTDSKGQPTTKTFILTPNQAIYSLLHFPNGPQCSSQATQVDAMVSYKISPNNSVSFKPTMGPTLSIPSCGEESDITLIDLYPFSENQVTP